MCFSIALISVVTAASKNGEAQSRDRWDAIIIRVGNNLEQLSRAVAALRRDDAELGHVSTDRV